MIDDERRVINFESFWGGGAGRSNESKKEKRVEEAMLIRIVGIPICFFFPLWESGRILL